MGKRGCEIMEKEGRWGSGEGGEELWVMAKGVCGEEGRAAGKGRAGAMGRAGLGAGELGTDTRVSHGPRVPLDGT